MNFENKHVDQLIELRHELRQSKDWKLCDEIRNHLDSRLIFVFDTTNGQEVYYLTPSYFRFKPKNIETQSMTNRQFVEYRIKREIIADKTFDAWLYSMRKTLTFNK